MDRFLLTARLKPEGRRRATALLDEHSVLGMDELESSLDRHAIFLTETEVIFVFEGEGADKVVRALFNDPVRSTFFDRWLPLLDGPLRRAREAYSWRARTLTG